MYLYFYCYSYPGLTHYATPDFKCWTSEGSYGLATSNIAFITGGPLVSSRGVRFINGYIDDEGEDNIGIGHRLYFLSPDLNAVSVGEIPQNLYNKRKTGSAVNVMDNYAEIDSMPIRDNGIFWPPPGYFPYALLPKSKRWSYWPFHENNIFTQSTVTVTNNSGQLPVTIVFNDDTQFGTIIVFEVTVPLIPPIQDEIYTVIINNIYDKNRNLVPPITYNVILMNIRY